MSSKSRSDRSKHGIDWQRLYDDGAVFVRLAGTDAQLRDSNDEIRRAAKKPISKWKGQDRLPIATYMSHIDQGRGIALQPSSKRWVMLDVDEGNLIDLLMLLSDGDYAYMYVKSRRKDGFHVYLRCDIPVGKLGNGGWRVGSARGEIRHDLYGILYDYGTPLHELDGKPGKAADWELFLKLGVGKRRRDVQSSVPEGNDKLGAEIQATVLDRQPQARLDPDGWVRNAYCENPGHDDLLPGAAITPEGRCVCARCNHPGPYQMATWLGIKVGMTIEAGPQWKLRSLMLQVWKENTVGLIEGIARIYDSTAALPTCRAELREALDKVNVPIPETTLDKILANNWLSPFLIPNDSAISINIREIYSAWVSGVLEELAQAHGRKSASKSAHKDRGLVDEAILHDLLGVRIGELGLTSDVKVAKADLESAGLSTLKPLPLPSMPIRYRGDFRTAFMRGYFDEYGEQSLTKWEAILGCTTNTVKSTAEFAGIERTERDAVKCPVQSVDDVFAKRPAGAKTVCIERALGGHEDFDAAMAIEEGDVAVYAPVSEHKVVSDPMPRKPRASSSEKPDASAQVEEPPVPPAQSERNNMEEPDDSWRGFGWDPRFVYWQALFILECKGWQVCPERRLLIYETTGEVEYNPTFERLKVILQNQCRPPPPELSPQEAQLVASAAEPGEETTK